MKRQDLIGLIRVVLRWWANIIIIPLILAGFIFPGYAVYETGNWWALLGYVFTIPASLFGVVMLFDILEDKI